jgi:hypothetical protein
MTKRDDDALRRSIDYVLEREPSRADQLDYKKRKLPWREIGGLASYIAQKRTLKLDPWVDPPSELSGSTNAPMDRLYRRLISAGLSQFEPDPLAALKSVGKGDGLA